MKIILYKDRNGKDKRIREALINLELFCENEIEDHQVCPDGSFDIGELGIIWGIPSIYKKNTENRKRIHDLHRTNKIPLLVIELGFLRRNEYYSIGYNSIVGFGYYGEENMPSDRFEKLNVKVKKYVKSNDPDKYILLCGQVYNDTQLQHVNYKKWLEWVVTEIKKYTKRKIVYRPHPVYRKKSKDWKLNGVINSDSLKKKLEEEMKNAHVIISFNSNSILDAMIEGIPFFSFDRGSVIYDISNHDLSSVENPSFPNDEIRMQRLYNIAYYQWNQDEIRQGLFFEHLKKNAEKSMDSKIDDHYHTLDKIFSSV